MPRLPRAARILSEQVAEHHPRATVRPIEDSADGLGVYRTLRVSKSAGRWLEPILGEIKDPRIAGWGWDDDALEVVFTASPDADRRDRFPLEAAETVVSDEHDGDGGDYLDDDALADANVERED